MINENGLAPMGRRQSGDRHHGCSSAPTIRWPTNWPTSGLDTYLRDAGAARDPGRFKYRPCAAGEVCRGRWIGRRSSGYRDYRAAPGSHEIIMKTGLALFVTYWRSSFPGHRPRRNGCSSPWAAGRSITWSSGQPSRLRHASVILGRRPQGLRRGARSRLNTWVLPWSVRQLFRFQVAQGDHTATIHVVPLSDRVSQLCRGHCRTTPATSR